MKSIKSNNILLLSTLIILLFFSSCSSKPETLKIIPEDTGIVSVIDVFSLAKKGQLYNIQDFNFFKTLRKEIRNEDKEASKMMEDMIDDPKSMGIDFLEDIIIFYVNEADDEQFTCVTAELSSESDFEDLIDSIFDKAKIDYEVEKGKGYNYILLDNEAVVGWDSDKMVLMTAINYRSRKNLDLTLGDLMTLKESKNITNNSKFNDFYSNKKDMSMWFSTDMLEMIPDFNMIKKEIDFDITGNSFAAHLNFEDDKIEVTSKVSPNDELEEMLEENDIYDNSLNDNLLKYFPEESYASASFSVNTSNYYKLLEKQMEIEKIEDEFKKGTGYEMEEFMNQIGGYSAAANFKAIAINEDGDGLAIRTNDRLVMTQEEWNRVVLERCQLRYANKPCALFAEQDVIVHNEADLPEHYLEGIWLTL